MNALNLIPICIISAKKRDACQQQQQQLQQQQQQQPQPQPQPPKMFIFCVWMFKLPIPP